MKVRQVEGVTQVEMRAKQKVDIEKVIRVKLVEVKIYMMSTIKIQNRFEEVMQDVGNPKMVTLSWELVHDLVTSLHDFVWANPVKRARQAEPSKWARQVVENLRMKLGLPLIFRFF